MLPLLLSLLALCADALAGEQRLTYDLSLDGSRVGTRELTVRYLQTGNGEIRILESYTDLHVNIAGTAHTFKSRSTAKAGGTPSFSSSIEQDGHLAEIQGRQLSDRRWTVDTAEDFEFVSRVFYMLYPTNPAFGQAEIEALAIQRLAA